MRSGLYLCNRPSDEGRGLGLLRTGDSVSSSGDSTSQGKMMEPAREIKENRTNARDPFRAISPTISVDDFNSAAVCSSCR